jgi:membrane peptidoglycan carboxypeptidase
MTNTLKDVIDKGTGRIIRRLGFNYPAAGKTGTTNENVDAWFIGFTPDLSCGVWVGYDERESLGRRQTGGETAAPIWADFMKAAMSGKPPKDFAPAPGTEGGFSRKRICQDSGELACPRCPRVQEELFKRETVPTKLCPLHCGANALAGDGSGNASGGGDILEMEAQAPDSPAPPKAEPGVPDLQSPPTPVPGQGGVKAKPTPKEKAPIADQQAYPDEGF